MSPTANRVSGVEVSPLIEEGLVIRAPFGHGEPMILRAPWDGAELARIPTATLEDMDVVLDREIGRAHV